MRTLSGLRPAGLVAAALSWGAPTAPPASALATTKRRRSSLGMFPPVRFRGLRPPFCRAYYTRRGISRKLGDWRLGHVVFGAGKQPQQIGAKAQGRTGRGVIAAEQGAEHAVLGLPVHH